LVFTHKFSLSFLTVGAGISLSAFAPLREGYLPRLLPNFFRQQKPQ
jgi:hypothetical protein